MRPLSEEHCSKEYLVTCGGEGVAHAWSRSQLPGCGVSGDSDSVLTPSPVIPQEIRLEGMHSCPCDSCSLWPVCTGLSISGSRSLVSTPQSLLVSCSLIQNPSCEVLGFVGDTSGTAAPTRSLGQTSTSWIGKPWSLAGSSPVCYQQPLVQRQDTS